MKVMSVKEALEEIKAKPGKNGKIVINRFSKKSFNSLMKAMINDPDFSAKVAKVKGGDLESVETVMVTKGFREWIKKLLEKAGIDKTESAMALSSDFEIDNVDGLYEFFVTAVYEYMAAGNRFDFMPTEDFKGGIEIKEVAEKTTIADAHSPQDRSYLGTFKTTKKAHKELKVKTSCPSFLAKREKVAKQK